MRREERRRKLHEALLNTLYPTLQAEDDQKPPTSTLTEDFDLDLITGDDDDAGFGDGGGGEGECGFRKFTRDQRKRLRKKKLREDISRRSKIIGPLLPPSTDTVEQDATNVRENADENSDSSSKKPGGEKPSAGSGNGQGKTKQRRMAKKLAKGKNVEVL